MGPITAVRSVLRRYARFSGRARRSEYWWFFLAGALALTGAAVVDGAADGTRLVTDGPVTRVTTLLLALPTLAVQVRRLHDVDRRGWWALLNVVLVIGDAVLLVFCARPGTEGPNRFGADPRPDASGPAGGRVAEDQRQTA